MKFTITFYLDAVVNYLAPLILLFLFLFLFLFSIFFVQSAQGHGMKPALNNISTEKKKKKRKKKEKKEKRESPTKLNKSLEQGLNLSRS